jgi:myo-inositol-1(or 4)-monophosphatase
VTDVAALRDVAVEAARAPARELLARFAGPAQEVRTKSAATDLVSAADHAAEDAVRAVLDRHRPDDGLLAEESGEHAGTTGLRWLVDPLDGTTNFLWGIPHWATSVACEDADGHALAAAVHDPIRDETYAAARGLGATCNGEALSVRERELELCTITGDFGAPGGRSAVIMEGLLASVGHVRCLGSAALDLAWVARGRCDAAYHERDPKPWDVAGGILVAREAGADVVLLDPVRDGCSHRLVAAAPELCRAVVAASA